MKGREISLAVDDVQAPPAGFQDVLERADSRRRPGGRRPGPATRGAWSGGRLVQRGHAGAHTKARPDGMPTVILGAQAKVSSARVVGEALALQWDRWTCAKAASR